MTFFVVVDMDSPFLVEGDSFIMSKQLSSSLSKIFALNYVTQTYSYIREKKVESLLISFLLRDSI